MALKEPKLTKKEVSQKFNLKELFGVDFSKNSDLRDNIAQEIIDVMLRRTTKSKDINGDNFEKYSTSYKKSDEFKDFKGSSKVNMELRGKMLEDIDVISETVNTVKIGFEDDLETKKAFAHNTGFEGHKFLSGKVKPRKFFGVTQEEINKIKKDFAPELKQLKDSPPKEKKKTIGDLLLEVETIREFF